MKKLEEIDRLVEEALNLLDFKDTNCWRPILTSLALKCAEINEEEYHDCYNTPGNTVNNYNSRLRDGQVEEVKQEEKSPSLKYYPLFKYFLDEHNVMLLETDYQEIERLLNIPPREWWRDLKKGDKFIDIIGEIRVFDGRIFLGSESSCEASTCSPYTDPAQSFRSKLTPEMQVEFDKEIVPLINKTNPQP